MKSFCRQFSNNSSFYVRFLLRTILTWIFLGVTVDHSVVAVIKAARTNGAGRTNGAARRSETASSYEDSDGDNVVRKHNAAVCTSIICGWHSQSKGPT